MLTIRILTFLSGCILALLKAVRSPLKKILAVNSRKKLVTENEATVPERDCKFAMFWPPDHEIVPSNL